MFEPLEHVFDAIVAPPKQSRLSVSVCLCPSASIVGGAGRSCYSSSSILNKTRDFFPTTPYRPAAELFDSDLVWCPVHDSRFDSCRRISKEIEKPGFRFFFHFSPHHQTQEIEHSRISTLPPQQHSPDYKSLKVGSSKMAGDAGISEVAKTGVFLCFLSNGFNIHACKQNQ